MKEMAKEVETVGQALPVATAVPAVILAPRSPEPVLAALPYSPRHQFAELGGSLLLAALLAALFTLLWAAITHKQSGDWDPLGRCFFLTVGCSWAVITMVKWWKSPVADTWKHRLAFLGLGLALGLEALWLEGHTLASLGFLQPTGAAGQAIAQDNQENAALFSGIFPGNRTFPALACYLSYFGMIFFVMRWWKLVEPKRSERFSLYAVLVAAFWAYVFFFLLPGQGERKVFFMAVVVSSVVIQLVSPWERPAPVRGKRLRLRYTA
jgi:hypothetical protein